MKNFHLNGSSDSRPNGTFMSTLVGKVRRISTHHHIKSIAFLMLFGFSLATSTSNNNIHDGCDNVKTIIVDDEILQYCGGH